MQHFTFTRYKVEEEVIASGRFADIREGKSNGMDVSLKTIRIPIVNRKELDKVHEVRKAVRCLILNG